MRQFDSFQRGGRRLTADIQAALREEGWRINGNTYVPPGRKPTKEESDLLRQLGRKPVVERA